MKFYIDKEKTQPLSADVIYFGEVKAGESKEITVWIHNDTDAILSNLKFLAKKNIPQAQEIKIIKPPITIQPDAVEPVTLVWSPTRTLKMALEIKLGIKYDEIYMAKKTYRTVREKQ